MRRQIAGQFCLDSCSDAVEVFILRFQNQVYWSFAVVDFLNSKNSAVGFFFNPRRCTASSVMRLLWDPESRMTLISVVFPLLSTETIAVRRNTSSSSSSFCDCAVAVNFSLLLFTVFDAWLLASCGEELLIVNVGAVEAVLELLLASKCKRLLCFRLLFLQVEALHCSLRCPGPRQLKRSPFVLIKWARSCTESALKLWQR